MPFATCVFRMSASSDQPASGIWNDGRGRAVHPLHARELRRTPARSATPGFPRQPFAHGANTEAKLLMLPPRVRDWQVLRVCFHTDVRNLRSRAALERIGGKLEGILRAHRWLRTTSRATPVRYSIIASDGPA